MLWRRAIPHYPAHLYFALHLHAAWFATLAIFTLATAFVTSQGILGTVGAFVGAAVIVYGLLALRRVFAESWLKTFTKSLILASLYGVSLGVMSLLILGYALMRA
jgi:hypothetical protein